MPDARNSSVVARAGRRANKLPNNRFVPAKGKAFINKLPPEVLSRIFEHGTWASDVKPISNDRTVDARKYLRELHAYRANEKKTHDDDGEFELGDEEGDEKSGSSSPRFTFPVLVSFVCRYWRDVALSTPALWTTMAISPTARTSYRPQLLTLKKSGDLPIDICISCQLDDFEDHTQAPSVADLRSLSSVLVPHLQRWRVLTIGVSEYPLMYEFLNSISRSSTSAASQLTTLELYYNNAGSEPARFRYPSMSKHLTLFGGLAPLLTTVALWGVHVDWNQPWISSASNLEDLELALHADDVCPSWAQFSTMLRGASALKKLFLYQSGPSGNPAGWFIEPTPGSPTDPNTPIQLLQLTDFTLARYSPMRAIGLFRKLRMPALKNLVLQCADGNYTDFVYELARPVIYPFPSSAEELPRSLLSRLESLKIIGLPCSLGCVETLYGELQNVTALKISLWNLPSLFLDILTKPCTLRGRGRVWLPRLVTFGVSGASANDLCKLVRKRRNAGVPLSALYVEKWIDDLEDDVEMVMMDVKWLMDNVDTLKFFVGDMD